MNHRITTIETMGIIERVERIKLYRQADLSGAGDLDVISFEAPIGFLVSQYARAHSEHGGEEIDCVSSYGDLGYFGSCITAVVTNVDDETRRYCRKYKIDPSSTLKVCIVAKQTVTPVYLRSDNIQTGSFGRKIYQLAPSDWSRSEDAVRALIGWRHGVGDHPGQNDGRLAEFDRFEEVIWRSDWPDEKNFEARKHYIESHIASLKECVVPNLAITAPRG